MFSIDKTIKFLILLIIILVVSYPVFPQYADSEKELIGLVGSVKTVIEDETKIIYENGKYFEKDRQHFRTTTYDLKGNIVEEVPRPGTEASPIVIIDGKSYQDESKPEYIYNKQGKIILENSILKDGTITSKRTFTYNSKGRLKESRFFDLNRNTNQIELSGRWFFVSNGNTIKSTLYEGCCNIKRWHLTKYNKKKDIIEISSYKADGSLTYKTAYVYEYDSVGNWTKRTLSSWNEENSKFEPEEVNYRIIFYY